jgi:hypothetical protein
MCSCFSPILRNLILRSLVFLRSGDKSKQILGRGMGFAHALKGIHTGRNPVFCHKINIFNKLPVYNIPKIGGSPVGDFLQKPNNALK